ncbi:MAG: hypothetical protein ACRD3O_05000, partial [Terriglobia bacterium]
MSDERQAARGVISGQLSVARDSLPTACHCRASEAAGMLSGASFRGKVFLLVTRHCSLIAE